MKIKLDENIPLDLVGDLSAMGHHVDTAGDEGLLGKDDQTVWAASRLAGRFLITQDLDFSDIRQFKPGTHPGILLVRLPFCGSSQIIRRINHVFSLHDDRTLAGTLSVLTDKRLRIRR